MARLCGAGWVCGVGLVVTMAGCGTTWPIRGQIPTRAKASLATASVVLMTTDPAQVPPGVRILMENLTLWKQAKEAIKAGQKEEAIDYLLLMKSRMKGIDTRGHDAKQQEAHDNLVKAIDDEIVKLGGDPQGKIRPLPADSKAKPILQESIALYDQAMQEAREGSEKRALILLRQAHARISRIGAKDLTHLQHRIIADYRQALIQEITRVEDKLARAD